VSLALVLAAALATQPAVVEQPRSFGYVIGDVATQRVLLEEQGRAFTPDPLPAAGPLGNWVERRAARIEQDTHGRRWLAVDYQIMNSPQAVKLIALPAWKLKGRGGELAIPEWPISVATLTPDQPFGRVGLGALRPDRPAPVIDVVPMRRWMNRWISGALAVILLWAGWWGWRNWQANARQPFAKALREIRAVDEGSSQAWLALHRAFDATAGRVVQLETLPFMFERAPRLEPQRSVIERFFAQSSARYFDTGKAASAAAPLVSVRALCAELRRIEKRHET
jgi:mxaA protein